MRDAESRVDSGALIDAIDALLPQTQCTKCGYPDCRAYAQAIAHREADINRCPPGGEAGIRALAALLDRPAKRLDPACGHETPRRVAVIDESRCIGCTLCIQACPVDAIVGAARQMHTVITTLCSGCDLCLPPCPVDCIRMVEPAVEHVHWTREDADSARARHARRAARVARQQPLRPSRAAAPESSATASSAADRQARIRAALDRARARRRSPSAASVVRDPDAA